MSVKGKKTGLVISWHKSFSMLAPWRKGKGNRHVVLDSEVVLTKIKLFNNFHDGLLIADDPAMSTESSYEQDTTKVSTVNSNLDEKSGELQSETSSDYISAILSDSQLQRLYKFESEDSGVELPSGANSLSTPTGSEQSFVVHSRGSSCDSSHLKSDPTTLTDKLVTYVQRSEIKEAVDLYDNNTEINTQDNVFLDSEEMRSSAARDELYKGEDEVGDQCKASGISPEAKEMCGQLKESTTVTGRSCFKHMRQYEKHCSEACDDLTGNDFEPGSVRRSATSESLEEYMDQCCRLSESQQESSNPLGSGLGYLEHICQLIEKIGQLQETNLQLQRQIHSLQKKSRMSKTKEDFFEEHCRCGAANLAFQDDQKRHSRSEFLSSSGILPDLSTIPEVSQHSLISKRRDMSSEGSTSVPLWRRDLNRRSYTEGEVHLLADSPEGVAIPQRRLGENYTWGRVKDLVRKTKLKNQSRLGLMSTSLKMSCPQLYMPDLGPVEPACRQRNSMIAWNHGSKYDFHWQQ